MNCTTASVIVLREKRPNIVVPPFGEEVGLSEPVRFALAERVGICVLGLKLR
jgi:hypothetical protein